MAEEHRIATSPRRERDDWPVEWQSVWGDDDGLPARLQFSALRATLALVDRLPDGLTEALISGLARLGPWIDRRHARAARVFLEQALGPLEPAERERRVIDAYRHLFRVVVDSNRFERRVPFERTPEHFEVDMCADARRVAAEPGGKVIVTAHLGNWEVLSAMAPWLGFDPLYAVAKAVRNRPLSVQMQRAREARGIRLLPRRGAMKDAQRIVTAGGSIGMLLDQRARKRPVLAPFFGRPARCDRSVGVLLRRLRVPVVLVFCLRTERSLRFRVEFPEVLWPQELSRSTPTEVATRINQAIERQVLRHPEQYFWLHDRYRDTPRTEEEAASWAEGDGLPPSGGLSSSPTHARDERTNEGSSS